MNVKDLARTICLLLLLLPPGGCGGAGDVSHTDGRIRVDLEKSDPERLLRYYFGGYVGPEGADPFAAGLVLHREGDYYLDLDVLERHVPGARAALVDRDGNGVLGWEELETFLQDSYYEARGVPETLAQLQAAAPYKTEEESWMRVDVQGMMTAAERHIYVPQAALRSALRDYHRNGERLLYPAGTAIVAEHHLGGAHVETTVMRKRADGFWDFITYGREGRLAGSTHTPPRALRTPTQCVGCHFGAKPFEPERSFPAAAPPGPHGPRALFVDEPLRDAEVTAFFNEHSKRSDTILGLYGTLFISKLRADRRAGRLSAEDAALLDALGL